MADTNILVTSATATGGVQQITHAATTDYQPGSCLSYLALISIEVWSAASNNRNAASKVGEIPAGGQFVQTGLGRSVTRFSWYRAKDVSGNLGDWFPAGVNAGLSAITSNQVPPPGSVGPEQTAGNFSSLSAISANLGVINAGTLNAVNVNGSVITGSTFRTAASGRRIQITSSNNYIEVYNLSGVQVASLGEFSLPGFGDVSIMYVSRTSSGPNVVLQNFGVGEALWTMGQYRAIGSGNRPAVLVNHNTNGLDAHGILFDVGPPSALGGAGSIGTSQASGGYAFFMNRGTIGPFTGAHPGMLMKADGAEPGDIIVDLKVLERHGINDTLTEVARSSGAAQRSALGVLSARTSFETLTLANLPDISARRRRRYGKIYDLATVNAVGEGQINVCGQGGNLERGDYICTSDLPGKGTRQNGPDGEPDDLQRRCTVARVRERVTFSSPTDVKTVACIYLCG